MNQEFSFHQVVELLKRNLKTFVVVGVLSLLAAVIFSGENFITPEYKSTAIVYPINLEPFSDESETEQLLQFFQSSAVRDTIINKFNLIARYDIDTTSKGWRFKLMEEYLDHVVASKTIYESVKLEIMDTDPVMARDIANEVLRQVNLTANRLLNYNAFERMHAYENQMNHQLVLVDSLTQLIGNIGNNDNLLHYEAQSREITRGYLTLLSSNNSGSEKVKEAKEMLENLQQKGPSHSSLMRMHDLMQNTYTDLYQEYIMLKKDAEQEVGYLLPVVEPDVTDKKAYPIRWLIVFLTVLSALLLTGVLLIFFDNRKA